MPNTQIPAAATGLPSEQPPSDASSPPKAYSDEWREARVRKARERFDQIYSDWLTARGDKANPANDADDEGVPLRDDREDEAARLLFITPAVLPWMVWKKVQAFEFYLCDTEGECQWTDRRHVAFFACVKADLARLGIGDGD